MMSDTPIASVSQLGPSLRWGRKGGLVSAFSEARILFAGDEKDTAVSRCDQAA